LLPLDIVNAAAVTAVKGARTSPDGNQEAPLATLTEREKSAIEFSPGKVMAARI
jgi:hypothetical protein